MTGFAQGECIIRLRKIITYSKYLLRHKFWVTYYCFRIGLFKRGLLHDLSKFSGQEFGAYVERFGLSITSGRSASGSYDASLGTERWKRAWNHHAKANDHHWQYWLLPKPTDIKLEDDSRNYSYAFDVLPMARNAVKEMFCDWLGASRSQGTKPEELSRNLVSFWTANRDKMVLNPDTYKLIDRWCGIILGSLALETSPAEIVLAVLNEN